MYFSWANKLDDEYWHDQMRMSIAKIKQVAVEDGIYDDRFTQYPNYALAGVTAEELYGANNAVRLREIRREVDPDRIMDLAGGFTI